MKADQLSPRMWLSMAAVFTACGTAEDILHEDSAALAPQSREYQASVFQHEEIVPASELDLAERVVFTTSGRCFVAGVRPDGRADAGGYIVEITNEDGIYLAQNVVAAHLEGTDDGTLSGAPKGEPCFFSGMAAHGEVLYASCVDSDFTTALVEVDLTKGTVRAGYFTSCNDETASAPCEMKSFYPNGMDVDDAGRIYVTDTSRYAGLVTGDELGSATITQIEVNHDLDVPDQLIFTHRAWFSSDIFTDGIAPNGIGIEDDILYVAAGPNINKIRIRSDGSAGAFRVHYEGPLYSLNDDFALRAGEMVIALVFPPALVGLDPSSFSRTAGERWSYSLPDDKIASDVAFQPDDPPLGRVFPQDALVWTSYFGGGVHLLLP